MLNFLQRIFEPLPHDWRTRFQEGDAVMLVRELPMHDAIPVGVAGVVIEVKQDGARTEKGRPIYVRFHMEDYCVPFPEGLRQALIRAGMDADEVPDYLLSVSANVHPDDIVKVLS